MIKNLNIFKIIDIAKFKSLLFFILLIEKKIQSFFIFHKSIIDKAIIHENTTKFVVGGREMHTKVNLNHEELYGTFNHGGNNNNFQVSIPKFNSNQIFQFLQIKHSIFNNPLIVGRGS